MEARANVPPRDYRIVYGEMKSYMWKCTTGDGMDAFCHERLPSTSSSYPDNWRPSLNRDVAKKLAQ